MASGGTDQTASDAGDRGPLQRKGEAYRNRLIAFRHSLNESGYYEGRNVVIEFRSADNQAARLHELATDLVRSQVAVIVAMDGLAVGAAKAATSAVPIVFTTNLDPVKHGFVASLNRPGLDGSDLDQLQNLGQTARSAAPDGSPRDDFGYLSDALLSSSDELPSVIAASRALGTELVVAEARSRSDIDTAFATFVRRGIGALAVFPTVLFRTNGNKILEMAGRNKIAVMFYPPLWVRRGGLMSYGASVAFRKLTADYVVRLLKGAKPADLPAQQATKFEFVINLKTSPQADRRSTSVNSRPYLGGTHA
jgi:putative tryptophan/tyrosine transport system substrate-binding protein